MSALLWIRKNWRLLLGLVLVLLWLGSVSWAWNASAASTNRTRDLADAKRAAAAASSVAGAEKRARDAEYTAGQKIAAIEAQYQENKDREIADRDRVIAELRAGQRRLFVNVRAPAAGSAAGAPGAGPAAQEARAELSPADGEFFIRFGSEADEVVNDLNYCIDRLGVAEAR
ncbi:lysis system i-spanin subunit Rz [Chromobacterium haemolyticum]|uniref:lysis system i-spanin subunit Rz n=1 Tax=Chromobacterium haemolyticum TaxID=394935 RepID=UPI0009DAF6C5|nr:lysis system i-spanin subunit Rz [Chromobacterium haemolyticum]